MIDINEIGKNAYQNAVKRKKTGQFPCHDKDVLSIYEEICEFHRAKEDKLSSHLPIYSEAEEELADILISCLTELHKRDVNIERIITDKICFNEKRDML